MKDSVERYTGELRIRAATEADAAVMAELTSELGYPNEVEAIRARIRAISGSDLLLVAVDAADKPAGFIQAHRVCVIEVGFCAEILGLVVSSKARRGGTGRKLIAEVEHWAESNGAEALTVRSNTKRTEAHVFYPAMGYKKIKTQAVYEKRLSVEWGARSDERKIEDGRWLRRAGGYDLPRETDVGLPVFIDS